MVEHKKRILMVGFGSVAQCTLPVLLKHIDVPAARISRSSISKIRRRCSHRGWPRACGSSAMRIAPENLGRVLKKYLSEGDVLIDLAWNIDCCEIVAVVPRSGRVVSEHVGRSLGPVRPRPVFPSDAADALLAAHARAADEVPLDRAGSDGHFGARSQSRLDLALHQARPARHRRARAGRQESRRRRRPRNCGNSSPTARFNQLAMKLGVKVIHCSERDTQITNQPKQVDEFVNTWSIEGFREEGTTTAEMGWGTHEKELPPHAFEHDDGPRNQICLAQMGMNTWVRSWVPNYTIRGMVVRHGEAFTISDKLTVWEDGQADLSPHGPLRLLPLRRGDRFAERTARLRLPIAAEPADHGGRNHRRVRHSRRAGDGPRLQLVVDRQRSEHRGIAPPGAAQECHDDAGGHLGRRGHDVDDPESGTGRLRARRSAARIHPGNRPALLGQVHFDARPIGRRWNITTTCSRATFRASIDSTDPWQFKNFLVGGSRLMVTTDQLAGIGRRAWHAAVRRRSRRAARELRDVQEAPAARAGLLRRQGQLRSGDRRDVLQGRRQLRRGLDGRVPPGA